MYAVAAMQGVALARAEAGERTASAKAFGLIHRCARMHPTIVGGL